MNSLVLTTNKQDNVLLFLPKNGTEKKISGSLAPKSADAKSALQEFERTFGFSPMATPEKFRESGDSAAFFLCLSDEEIQKAKNKNTVIPMTAAQVVQVEKILKEECAVTIDSFFKFRRNGCSKNTSKNLALAG